jgi:hypothetical protein
MSDKEFEIMIDFMDIATVGICFRILRYKYLEGNIDELVDAIDKIIPNNLIGKNIE